MLTWKDDNGGRRILSETREKPRVRPLGLGRLVKNSQNLPFPRPWGKGLRQAPDQALKRSEPETEGRPEMKIALNVAAFGVGWILAEYATPDMLVNVVIPLLAVGIIGIALVWAFG